MIRTIALIALVLVACDSAPAPATPPAPASTPAPELPVPDDSAPKPISGKRASIVALSGKVDRIRDAARARDHAALSAEMCPEFAWTGDGPPGREAAIADWTARPVRLDALVALLDGDCGFDSTKPDLWSCPATPTRSSADVVSFTSHGDTWQWCRFGPR